MPLSEDQKQQIEEARRKREEAADYLREKLPNIPRVVIELGTGQNEFAETLDEKLQIPYGEIPYFRVSTAPFHAGVLVHGKLTGKPVLVMQGRLHRYEGYTWEEITFPIRVWNELGIKILVACNGGGASNPYYRTGDLMIIRDHLNFLWGNPLVGVVDPDLGPDFVDMTDAYSPRIREIAKKKAAELDINIHEGVYVANLGRTYETPAETLLAFRLGGDLVGMSTVPEVIIARHMGMEVFGLSQVGNIAAGLSYGPLPDHGPPSLNQDFAKLLAAIVSEIA